MVSPGFAFQSAKNIMKNTIDDVDYIINLEYLFIYNQCLINSSHSLSIINKPFLSFVFNNLFSDSLRTP